MLAQIWNCNLKNKSKLYYERYWAGTNEALGLSTFYDQALEEKENYILLSLVIKLPLHVGNA